MILPVGWLPTLYPRNFVRPTEFRIDSARMLRAELPVQRKRTLKTRSVAGMPQVCQFEQQAAFVFVSADADAVPQHALFPSPQALPCDSSPRVAPSSP